MGALLPVEDYSRRRFVGSSAALLGLAPGVARAQSIVPPPAGQPQDPNAARIATETDAAKHLSIAVMIGGKGPFRFVVDTGADRSVIADDVAMSLGLIKGKTVTVQGVVRSIPSQTVTVSDISFGSGHKINLLMPTLPRALLGADGYLGLDAIDGYRVSLDFRHKELVISEPRVSAFFQSRRPSETVVPVRGSMGHLRSVNCRVDGVSTTTFIDTGAEVSVGNSKLFEALIENDPGYIVMGMLPITGVTGGQIVGKVIEAHRIKLHAITFEGCVLLIADMQIFDIWGLSDSPALLIGMNFLRQFNEVSIDYGRKELMFDIASMLVAQRT